MDVPAPLNTIGTSTSRTIQGYFWQVSLTMVKFVTPIKNPPSNHLFAVSESGRAFARAQSLGFCSQSADDKDNQRYNDDCSKQAIT
jgi:hypothetical protein